MGINYTYLDQTEKGPDDTYSALHFWSKISEAIVV